MAERKLHPSCVTDLKAPSFDEDWQRRAFGLAVALAEFGHYRWDDFQQALIAAIGSWQETPTDIRGRWEYYEHWVAALSNVVRQHGLLDNGYINPEDRRTTAHSIRKKIGDTAPPIPITDCG